MIFWIILGVLAIALVAALIRVIFNGSGKRRAPVVFGSQPSADQQESATETESRPTRLLSEGFRDDPLPAAATKPDISIDNEAEPGTNIAASIAPSDGMTDGGAAVPSWSPVATPTNRLKASGESPIFSQFRGIVGSDSHLVHVVREELPLDEDDLTFGSTTAALAQLLPESETRKDRHRRNLVTAGYHSRGALLNLNSIRFVLAFLALVIVGFWLIMAPPAAEPYLLAAVVALPLVGWALPPLLISSKATERRTDVERGLPDALDMLNMGVSQGLTVQSSLNRIGPEIEPAHPALSQELKIVSHQAHVGSLSQALNNFATRMDSSEVNSFTSLLIQSEATGTSISRAISEHSDSMRDTMRERADSKANAASFKLLFPTVLCLMPSVFLFLLGPAVVSLTDFFGGTAEELLEDRTNAINSLEQGPRVIPEDSQ